MSRAFARALPVAIAAVLRAGTARAGEDVALARALTAPRLSSGVYCMWQAASFGTTSRESAAWLVETRSGLGLVLWPSASGPHRSRWSGDPPRGAVAVLHTHPRADGPRPSPHDAAMARRLELPVAVISREGIFSARPDGRIVQDLASEWHAAYRGLALRECGAPPPPDDDCRRPASASPPTSSAAFARADGLDSWR